MDRARRHFLRGKFLTRDGREEIEEQTGSLGPLPPWHAGYLAQQDCAGCAQPCIKACETGVIKIHPAEHGLAGLPYLDFSNAGCTHCYACVKACPVDIKGLPSEQPVIGLANLDQMRCHAWNNVFCISCMHSCDQKAIVFSWMKYPEVHSELCNGCGQCVSVCPADAFKIAERLGQ